MKAFTRRAALAAGFVALPLAGAPLLGQAGQQQRGGPPVQDTPYILVTTFHSTDRQLGVQMGDEFRRRLISEHAAKELYVIPQQNIKNTLEASGYRADSALSASDLMELAKTLRGDQVIDGTANKVGAGIQVDARVLMRSGQQTVAQPLPRINAKDVGDAVKQLEQKLTDAQKSFPAYRTCTNDLRAAKYSDAIADARKGLALYPQSVLAQQCILLAYTNQTPKASPDSIIAVATAIRNVDSTAMVALANLADAYMAKHDTANAINTYLSIYRLDPSNTNTVTTIIEVLANSGAPDKAIPIIDTLIQQNPGDVGMLKTKWLLQLRAKQYKAALATGAEYVKADTSKADLDYFQRSIAAAGLDSNVAMQQQLIAQAMQKFGNKVPIDFPLLAAQGYYKAGQLQQALAMARRATEIDPKNTGAWQFIISIQSQMSQPDSALASAQKAIAAGVPKDTLGASLLAIAAPALKKAQETKTRADFQAALQAFQTVDQIAPSPQSSFYIGVAAYSIAGDALQNVQKIYKNTKEKATTCSEIKVAEDNLAIAQEALPKGGRADPQTAGQLLQSLPQYSEFATQVKNALHCK
ncbi:MAG TPA: hypothetical protein VN706_21790 [Gemmatimonadaceae bacterium]|nr:hypothetical protein [Gemmatimonadaceae bacterium]